jgi:DNA mismatch repair protein MutS2
MSGDSLERLEYPRLRELLLELATSFAGRSRIESMCPFPVSEEAEYVLSLVAGLKRRHEAGNGLPPMEVGDLGPVLGRLGTEGAILNPEEIQGFLPLLQSVRGSKKVLELAADDLPEVAALAEPLLPLPHLEKAIDETFEPGGGVKDRASPSLRSIRRERETKRERLRSRMEHLAAGLTSQDAATLVTLREGRFVLAVPQAQKAKIEGLVQDRSGSGATFYMEPLEAVSGNNVLRELDAEERAEIRRILAALTARLVAEREGLAANWEHVGYLDALRARVLLAIRWGGELPKLTAKPRLRLRSVRHPLLLEARGVARDPEAARKAVIPLELELDEETRILLITGPNMGGKTVALKALGLLSAMAESGCLIPADPGCELPWVGKWLVSLGDEQSLENDLSTFAAHLRRWAEALEEAGPGALVLLDELGSGTDPTEGAALAQSVLERLVEARAMGLVTTHLGTLKAFAASVDGIRNASMTFDPETRRPTYGLAVGVPGESHAIDMARQLGFPEERVVRAEELLPEEERDVKRLLEELNEERRRLAASETELRRRLEEAGRLGVEHKERLERLLEERASLRTKMARQAREMVRRAEETLRQAEKSARSGKRSPEVSRANLARQQARLARVEAPRRKPSGGRVPDTVREGDRFWAEALGRDVEVIREPDGAGRVLVVSEGMRVELPRTALRVLEGQGGETALGKRTGARPRTTVPEVQKSPIEVHLRGLRVDESLDMLDRALDQAMLAGLREIRVIHGKGTGTLRRAVEEFCRTHTGVKSARVAEQWEGGTGATVIELEG